MEGEGFCLLAAHTLLLSLSDEVQQLLIICRNNLLEASDVMIKVLQDPLTLLGTRALHMALDDPLQLLLLIPLLHMLHQDQFLVQVLI